MQKVIALAADYQYCLQVETTIKSVAYHNHNVKFYLINSDYPREWFYNLNRSLRLIGCELIDKKIDLNEFAQQAPGDARITKIAWGRFFIPQLIDDPVVLYLDSDVIINNSLDELFAIPLEDYPLAAVKDISGDYFNNGIMLLNNRQLKKDPDLPQKILKAGQDNKLKFPDQTVINHFFNHKYLPLDLKYNYPIGDDIYMTYMPQVAPDYFSIMDKCPDPVIIHYVTDKKPWQLTNGARLHQLWWQYHNLNWYQVITKQPLPNTTPEFKGELFTFTASDDFEHLEDLLKTLPEWKFVILSWSAVSDKLLRLTQYHNLELIPEVSWPIIHEKLSQANAYLDINRGPKEHQFITQFVENHKPILAFWATAEHYEAVDQYDQHTIVGDNDLAGMVENIHQLKAEGN